VGPAFHKKHLDHIYNQVCSRCGGHIIYAGGISEDMQRQAEIIAKKMYAGKIVPGTIEPGMVKLVATELRKAIIEGFGKDLPAIDYGTPDYKMLLQLEKNIFHFSAAENYQMLKSMSLALRDEDGKLRTFKAFRDEAMKISGVYLDRNLKTEYNGAVASSQMAGKWVDIEQNKESAPFLRYDTVGDDRVRQAHKELDGVIRPVDDSFWSVYYPPNGWNCRCDVTQLLHGSPTPAHKITTPEDVPAIFQTNLAKNGLVFPANHPYYIDAPAEVLSKAQLLIENQYSPIQRTKSMKADVHVASLADQRELDRNISLSRSLAEYGHEVYIEPHSTSKGVKNPELKLGSLTGDFKTQINTGVDKFVKNSIDTANKQKCNVPVLVIPGDKYDKNKVWRGLRADLSNDKRKKNVVQVWLLLDKALVILTREAIVKGDISKLP